MSEVSLFEYHNSVRVQIIDKSYSELNNFEFVFENVLELCKIKSEIDQQ